MGEKDEEPEASHEKLDKADLHRKKKRGQIFGGCNGRHQSKVGEEPYFLIHLKRGAGGLHKVPENFKIRRGGLVPKIS
jgi:hypothetical protein